MMRRSLLVLLFIALFSRLQAQAGTVYFWVSNAAISNCTDGYVLPLNNPSDIQHARDLIDFLLPTEQRLVVAEISFDFNGININRNYCDAIAPSWSWYVKEFIGFADYTEEILDGTPTGVENGGFEGNEIGFWSYTVVAELGTSLNPWCEVLYPDCSVDIKDLVILVNHFLEDGCEYPLWCGSADLDVSGSVDFYDFALLANRWLLNN